MKIILKKTIICSFFVFLLTIVSPFSRAFASESDSMQSNSSDTPDYQKQLEELIPREYSYLFDFSNGITQETVSGASGAFFLNLLLTVLSEVLGENLPLLAIFISISAVCGIFKCFSSSFPTSLSSAFSFTVSLISAVILMKSLLGCFAEITTNINKLSAFIGNFVPILCGVTLSSGSISTASAASAHFSLIMSLLQSSSASILSPLMRICLIMNTVSGLTGKKEISSVSSFLCNLFSWGTGIVMLIITTVFAFQTNIASSGDSLALRTAKLASSSIPLVGSALSQASGTILGSMTVIKNICGSVGIIIVILLFLPPLIKLLLTRTVLSLCSTLASALMCDELSNMLSVFGKLLGFGIAIYVISDITVIISVALMMTTSL